MRILYGVHGYGRGHATRTLAVLPHLAERHRIQVLAGGDAHATMWSEEFPVTPIPTLGFAYRKHGSGPQHRSNWGTFLRNLPPLLDLTLRGPVFDMVRAMVEQFAPDVIISDAECFTSHVAAHLRIPRIGFDHIGILAYCRPPLDPRDRLKAWFDARCYRYLMGTPDRVLVSSFFDAPRRPGVRVVGTLPRQAIRELVPTNGVHLLVYFNRGDEQLRGNFLQPLAELGLPVHIYGTSRRGREGNLSFLPTSGLPFLEDLAGCRAVISTAGNQLVGEAMFLGKPLLVLPERCVEQRMNALAVERMGIGRSLSPRSFNVPTLRKFLGELERYREAISGKYRDGLPEAAAALEKFIEELTGPAQGRGELLQGAAS